MVGHFHPDCENSPRDTKDNIPERESLGIVEKKLVLPSEFE